MEKLMSVLCHYLKKFPKKLLFETGTFLEKTPQWFFSPKWKGNQKLLNSVTEVFLRQSKDTSWYPPLV